MANENDTKNESQGILARLRRNKWWQRLTRTVLILVVVAGLLIVFESNRFFYLSHQRFSIWSHVQWKYQLNSNVKRSRLQIIGHRGSGLKSTDTEAKVEDKLIGNTASAIKAAIKANVDWIEIDIRKSADDELLIFHDSNVTAKTNFDNYRANLNVSSDSTGEVSELTLAQLEMLTLNVKPKEKILTLDEVFTSFHSSEIRWIFDIKESGIRKQVLDWLKVNNIPKSQLILFGDYDVLKEFKGTVYQLGYTTLYAKSWNKMLFNPSKMFDRCDELGCKLMVVPIFFVTTTLVNTASDRGIDVWCYDSNDVRDLKYATGCGVKGVIGDYPKEMMNDFKNLDQRSQTTVR